MLYLHNNRGTTAKLMIALCLLLAAGSLHAQSMNWTQETAAAQWSERHGHATVSFRGKLWVLGGFAAGNITNDIWSSTDGVNWTLEEAWPAWSPRFGHAVTVFNDRLWLTGGTNGAFGVQDGDFNDVWSSPDGISWTLEQRNAVWERRSRHAAVVFDDRLWIMGGFRQGGGLGVYSLNDVWWSTDGVLWFVASAAASWSPRAGHGVAVFNDRIWLTGGGDFISSNYDDVWSSADGAAWTQEVQSAPWSPRFSHSTVAYNNRLWVVGNEVNSSNPPDVWSSTNGVSWTLEDSSPQWPTRGGFSCLVHDGHIWLMGGSQGLSTYNDVWSYSEPMSIMQLQRNNAPIFHGFDSLGGVDIAGDTFTWEIHNVGTQPLNLTGAPRVEVTPGTGAPAVNVAVQPGATVAPSAMTSFQIQVTPSLGAFNFTVSIESNDPAADPHLFTIRGQGSNTPEVRIERAGSHVSNAGTDRLGGVSTSGETFTWEVKNIGALGLDLTGTPRVALTPGAGAPMVSVVTQPVATVASNDSTSFTLDVMPATFGTFDFTVSIDSNDPLNAQYVFTVQGVGRSTSGWVQETPAAQWGERAYHSAIEFNGQLWVLGGFDTASAGTHGDIWSSSDGVNWAQAPAVGHWPSRFGHAVAVFNNRIWVMGGVNGLMQTVFNDVWSSADGINWTLETASPGWVPRFDHAVTVFNNRMWVLGGTDEFMMLRNDVWSSADGVNWIQEPASGHWSERSGLGANVFNNRLWVTGGWDQFMAAYDVWSSADGINWTQETSFAGWPARAYHGSAVYNDRLWVLGGETSGFGLTADVWSSADGVNWLREEVVAPWGARHGFAATIFNNAIWLAGGDGSDVWSYSELAAVPAPIMRVNRNAVQIPNGGVDALGGVSGSGQTFTWEVANHGTANLNLSGTPTVAVTPGVGAPTVNVLLQPAATVQPAGTTTFQVEIIPSPGAFDFIVSIDNNDPAASPYVFTVQGNGLSPNLEAQADLAPGSAFAGATNGPFTLILDPGQSLTSAEIQLTDPESDHISVVAISAIGSAPGGIVEPQPPAPNHPVLLAWTGTADASNPPGGYAWEVEFADAGNGTSVFVDVIITIRDLEPEHTIANAEGGDGSAGDPYRATFNQGDDGTVSVELAHISDPNTSQTVSVDSVSPAGLFDFSIGSGFLTVAPVATLSASDRGMYAIDVTITDGSNLVTIAVSIHVYGNTGAITFTTPGTLPAGIVNRAYDQLIEVSGATGGVEFDIVSGLLVSGLTLDPSGRLHGTPTGTGTVTFTVRAIDSTNDTAARQFELTVRAPASGNASSSGGCAASGGGAAWMIAPLLAAGIAMRRRKGLCQ